MRRHLRSLGLVLLCAILLTGCWDAREVEERTSVIAIGVDRHAEGYEVTIQVPIPLKVVGGGGGEGGESGHQAVQTFTGRGSTLSRAIDQIQDKVNQELFFGHTRLFLVGEELAKEGIEELLDSSRRQPQARRRQWMLVVKGKARDAIESEPKMEQIPMQYYINMIETGVRLGRFAEEGLGAVFSGLANPGKNPVLNYVDPKNRTVRWAGLGVMAKDRVVGVLTRREATTFLQIRSKELGEPLGAPCPEGEGRLVFEPKELTRKIRIYSRNHRPEIRVTVQVKGGIIEKTCHELDLSKQETMDRVTQAVQATYQRRARHLVKKVQKELKADGFNFGNHVRAYHPDLWKRIDWDKEFPRMKIHVSYDVDILRTGLRYK
ncbi:Ger(x)C family spore germination protein [Paludifilum halophilum]|nr:Ger(x)C family spore germination protein [Paludifilum halophilum]